MNSKMVSCTLLLCLLVLTGCGRSSREEAVYALQQDVTDFKEVVQTMKISGPFWCWVEVNHANPVIVKKENSIYSTHVIIYRTNSGGLRVATMNWNRPPKLTGLSQEFK